MAQEMSKKLDEAIKVELEGDVPKGFEWRGSRYAVDRLIKYWREAGGDWDPEVHMDHECYRVESGGGMYDLRRDLTGKQPPWRLLRVWD